MRRDRLEQVRQMMARNDLFRHLGDELLDQLVGKVRVTRYRPNQSIFLKGEPGTTLQAVLTGRVKISNVSADGKEVVLNIIDPGEFFGEIALLDGKDRTANATALEDTELLCLHRSDFMNFLQTHPGWAVHVIETLCCRVRLASEMVEDSAFLTLPIRLAKRLMWLAESYGAEVGGGIRIDLKLTQRELGGLVGLSRENINRQLKAWQKDGMVDLAGGFITITDMGAMEDLAEYYS
ncbi:MAG: Crp/Fnr family transcriptional regulator [Rhodobacterales bacterium]|nr:Crp/Fnr family transcriptional regulator [Rhodobacterales bacterium]